MMSTDERHFSGTLSQEEINKAADDIFTGSRRNDLLWDMDPQKFEDGSFVISLSDEDGNGEDYWYFETEEQAEKVLDQLGVLLEKNN